MYPVKKVKITCDFGVKGSQWMSGQHQGYDFGGRIGTDVFAVADGKVIGIAIWGSAFGKHAPVIKHGKVFPRYVIYGHMRMTTVKVGQKVSKGDKVGEIGVEGNSGGPHLHIEGQKTPWWRPNGGVRLTSLFKA